MFQHLNCTRRAAIPVTDRQTHTHRYRQKHEVRRFNNNSGITVHMHRNQHNIDWDGANITNLEPLYWKRRVKKAIRIRTHCRTMNLDYMWPDVGRQLATSSEPPSLNLLTCPFQYFSLHLFFSIYSSTHIYTTFH